LATASNMKELEKLINQKIKSAMQQEVSTVARKTMKEQVIEEVYDRYTPSPNGYKRTGGLYQDRNIETVMENDNTLSVRNIRKDEKTGRLVSPIIEEGVGYTWKNSDIYQMQPFPRPFHAETLRELTEKDLAKNALVQGLKRQGLDVR
jgi:hypothetical protein